MPRLLLALALLFLGAARAFAQTNPALSTWDSVPTWHTLPNGQPDNGTTVAGPNGTSSTTFSDGWTKTVEPDNTFTPPGTKTTIKDGQGRTREIIKADSTLKWRHQTWISRDGFTTVNSNWRADGSIIDSTKETDDPAHPPKKTETWDPKTGQYVLASATTPDASPSGLSAHLNAPTLVLVAIIFLLGLFIGRAWGAKGAATRAATLS
jgi:hypothetical protein